MSGSFSLDFDRAFDVVGQHTGGAPIRTFVSDRPPGAGDHAHVGEMWIDESVRPIPVWVMLPAYVATDPPGWMLSGMLKPLAGSSSSARLRAAALLLAVRWYKLPDAPLGLVGGYDIGASYVGRIGRDLEEMLIGYRGIGVPIGQVWPTISDLKERIGIGSSVSREDEALEIALEAAIEGIMEFVDGPPGVG